MASVQFKKGLLANLPAAKAEGTFYVTTDERGLYLDVNDETRIRIGDFQEFADLEALEANANPSTTALYYVNDINCLAKWDGSKYVQINLDTGATDVEVTGDGNAITGASYNVAARKIVLTKGAIYATASDIASAITDLNLADTYEEKGAAAKAKEDVIGKASDTKDSDTIKGAKKYADAAADAKDTAIAEAKKAGTDAAADAATAQAAAEAAQNTADGKVASIVKGDDSVVIGGTATAPTVAVAIDPTAGNNLTLVAGKGLRVEVPAAAEYSVVKAEDSGEYAAVYRLTKNGTPTGAAINIPKDMVVKSGKVTTENDKTYIVLVLNDADETEIKIDAASLIEYVTSGSEAGDMVVVTVDETTHKVTAAITDGTITAAKLTTELQTTISTAATKAAANETAITNMKDGESIDSFGDVETALAGKQDTIPANTYDAYGAASAAQTAAQNYADGLASNYDAAGAANAVQTAVVGTASDQASADTINGAKAYADAAVAAGMTWGSF